MKTVKELSLVLVCTIVLISCKNSETSPSEIEIVSENEIALAETITQTENNSNENYLYVMAPTGLSLREYANIQSEKLAVMPYGTRVKVIALEEKSTMKIGEINGGMDEIEFNHKKGFAFNGYLSKYFPPEKDISAKGYAEELIEGYPKVTFTEATGGTASKPTNTETLMLPDSQWREAFFIAQQLFNFPKEFVFPPQKGKERQTIKEKKFQKNSWTSELQITRKDDALSKIEYVYKNKGFSKLVTITKEGNTMKISKSEIVE